MQQLTASQIEQAKEKVLENVAELVEEAEMLLGKSRYPRAYFLAYLAIEEASKLPMLTRIGVELAVGRTVDWRKHSKRIRNHKAKMTEISLIDYLLGLALKDTAEPTHEHNPELDAMENLENITDEQVKARERSLYTDMIEGSFKKPSEVITKEQADSMVSNARGVMAHFCHMEGLLKGALKKIMESPELLSTMSKELDSSLSLLLFGTLVNNTAPISSS